MMRYPRAILKIGKDAAVRAGHPWVFSEAIAQSPNPMPAPGSLVEVISGTGESLGIGTWNGKTSIRIRLISRSADETVGVDFFIHRFTELDAWKQSHLPEKTTGYRLVHAEVDGLPGLIVDRYNDVCVFQIHTAGMDLLRDAVIGALDKVFSPTAIVERSDVDARRMEGLTDLPIEVCTGEVTEPVSFSECGITFAADVLKGQKTGFFLDQREVRRAVGTLSKGKRVLNLFGYTGAFSVHAALGGAKSVATVDSSLPALEAAEHHFRMNELDPEDKKFSFLQADIFQLLEDEEAFGSEKYDLIICDPPALAKGGAQVERALKAYTFLNTECFRLLQPGGILVSSSCSGRVDPEMFRSMLRISAGRAARDVRVLDWMGLPDDHAERLSFSEGRYLKTAILEVRDVLREL